MHKTYCAPSLRVRPVDLERDLLTRSFIPSQNEEIEEIDFEW